MASGVEQPWNKAYMKLQEEDDDEYAPNPFAHEGEGDIAIQSGKDDDVNKNESNAWYFSPINSSYTAFAFSVTGKCCSFVLSIL